jgi:hypothetical protein
VFSAFEQCVLYLSRKFLLRIDTNNHQQIALFGVSDTGRDSRAGACADTGSLGLKSEHKEAQICMKSMIR